MEIQEKEEGQKSIWINDWNFSKLGEKYKPTALKETQRKKENHTEAHFNQITDNEL